MSNEGSRAASRVGRAGTPSCTLLTEGQKMIRTVEAVIELPSARRALVTILEDRPVAGVPESALLSEVALDQDWSRRRKTRRGPICKPSCARPWFLLTPAGEIGSCGR